jgi:hypothetical protein
MVVPFAPGRFTLRVRVSGQQNEEDDETAHVRMVHRAAIVAQPECLLPPIGINMYGIDKV